MTSTISRNQSLHRTLFVKEMRQLAPLGMALISLCLMLLFLIIGFAPPEVIRSEPVGFIILAMPLLFSVGAGAMSVGQEKDLRTILWLRSLPISARTLVTIKLASGVIWLAAMWSLTFLIHHLDAIGEDTLHYQATDNIHPIESAWAVTWTLHSVFLLLAGYLTAWLFPNAMASLAAIAPVAFLPSLSRFAVAYVLHPGLPTGSSVYDASLTSATISLAVFGLATAGLIYLIAMRQLGPARAPRDFNPYDPVPAQSDFLPTTFGRTVSPQVALLWKSLIQNKWLYLSLTATALVFGWGYVAAERQESSTMVGWTYRPHYTMGVMAIASWIGVMTFQSDNTRDRVRFLADRGVSPWMVWYIQWIPSLVFVMLLTNAYALAHSDLHVRPALRPMQIGDPSLVASVVSLWVVLGAWFGQLVRNPIVAVIGAPVVAALGTAGIMFASIQLTMPLILIYSLAPIPLIATGFTMKRWMDRRLTWPFWLTHTACAAASFVIAAIWLIVLVNSIPRMPSTIRNRLTQECQGLPDNQQSFWVWESDLDYSPAVESTASTESESSLSLDSEDTTDKESSTFEDKLPAVLARMRQMLSQGDMTIAWDKAFAARLANYINLHGDDFEIHPTRTDTDTIQQASERFEALMLYTKLMRRSRKLNEQHLADELEIILIASLRDQSFVQLIDDKVRDEAIRFVANKKQRNESRRAALLTAWRSWVQRGPANPIPDIFSALFVVFDRGAGTMVDSLTRERRVEHLIATLDQLLIDGPSLSEAEIQARLDDRWPALWYDPDHYQLNNRWMAYHLPRASSIDARDPKLPLSEYSFQYFPEYSLPGELWFAGWEDIGEQLKGE